MPIDGESLNIIKNFKVTPAVEAAIAEESKELGLKPSAYMRLCVFIAGPMLMQCPGLKDKNRMELKELAEDIGKTLVIHPPRIEWGKRD